MKTNHTRGKGGRKKFSAAKFATPDNSPDRNIDLLAVGDCATNAKLAEAFKVVALWEKFHSPSWPNRKAARSLESRLLKILRESLARIEPQVRMAIFKAVSDLDPEPFRAIAVAIDVTKRVNEHGAFQTQLVRAALLAEDKFGVEMDAAGRICLPVTAKEFAEAYDKRYKGSVGKKVNPDYLRRECLQKFGWHFKPDKTGRRLKTPIIVSH